MSVPKLALLDSRIKIRHIRKIDSRVDQDKDWDASKEMWIYWGENSVYCNDHNFKRGESWIKE